MKLLAATQAVLAALGTRLDRADQIDYDRDLATLRAKLDEATFAASWAVGQAMTLEQAMAYARLAIEGI